VLFFFRNSAFAAYGAISVMFYQQQDDRDARYGEFACNDRPGILVSPVPEPS